MRLRTEMVKGPIVGKHPLTDQERLDAITPLLKFSRVTEEQVSNRSAEVGVSARSLRRWIAAHKGRHPGETKLRFDFPEVAIFVLAQQAGGKTARRIHQELRAMWPDLNSNKPCPSYTTILCFLRATVRP